MSDLDGARRSRLARRAFLQSAGAAAALSALGHRQFACAADPAADLIVRSAEPLNAEPALLALVASRRTPVNQFYIRSHGPTPKLKEDGFTLHVEGLVHRPLALTLEEIKRRFLRRNVEATLTCAGNRRQELSALKPVGGVQWDAGAIGHADWSGARLADVLKAAEVKEGAKHVWFEGLDSIREKDGSEAPFGGSIPLEKALANGTGSLLAYRMNDEPLTAEHGFPLRTVVPGYIGARSVKWLAKVVVSDRPSPNHYVADAYKIIQAETKDEQAAAEPIYAFPVNAAICVPADRAKLKAGQTLIAGYALPSGEDNATVGKVELSRDGGRTWMILPPKIEFQPFCWRLWSADVDLPAGSHELVVRVTDSRGKAMPEKGEWNAKGYLYNGWHRVTVDVT